MLKKKENDKNLSILMSIFVFIQKKILTNRCCEVIILKHVRESVGMVDKHV